MCDGYSTSTTRGSAEVLARNLPPRTIHQFLPLDAPGYLARFLDHWRPDAATLVVVGDVNSRRGMIVSTETASKQTVIVAEIPLAETFGYSTDLRSMTQGKGTFSMEPCGYRRTPSSIQEEIIAEKKKQQLVGAK